SIRSTTSASKRPSRILTPRLARADCSCHWCGSCSMSLRPLPQATAIPFMPSALFTPIRLADLELANRIVVAPMCQYSANDGVASDWHINHLGMLANSGAGLVIAEMCDVERHGRISHGCLGLYSDACEDALKR